MAPPGGIAPQLSVDALAPPWWHARPPLRRALARHARALPATAVAAGICGAYVALLVAFSHPAVPITADGYGYTGSTALHGLMRWDGAWYAAIAEHGYAPLTGRYQPYAFLPLFPAVVAAVHALLPFLSIAATGLSVNIAAALGAAALLYHALPQWTPAKRTAAVALIFTVPSAFFAVTFYTEALFLFATAQVLWAVRDRQRVWWAAAGVVIATLDRPIGLLLVVFVIAAVLHDERPRWQRTALLGTCVSGVLLLAVFYWRVAGDPLAFLTAQNGWSSLRTMGGPAAARWLIVQLNPATATNIVVFFGYAELFVVGLPLLVCIRRDRAAFTYCGLAMLVAFVNGNVGAQSRYLATLVPLWVGALAVLERRSHRAWSPVVAAALLAGVACNVWLMSRFASGLWAG